MKVRFLLLVIGLILLLIVTSQPLLAQSSQEPSGVKNVTLWLYPEYDDPRLLFMLEGKITGAVPPATVRFLVPNTAEMYSAGSIDPQGKYTGGPPNRKTSEIPGWDEISYELKTDTFRVEYYDDIIQGNPDKKIAYDFRFLYPISDLEVIVQQPLKASDFAVSPAGKPSKEGNFNVNTHSFSNPDLSNPLHFDISYVKTDPNPSVGTAGNAPANSNPSGSVNPALIVMPIILIVAVGAFILASRLKKRRPALARSVTSSRQPTARSSSSTNARYCDQCGKPQEKKNRFCPSCGNTLDKPA